MPDQKIFCNSPWYELHVYWDGSLGICCQESHKLYSNDQQYNIADISIQRWFNSEPVRKFRQSMLGSQKISACSTCTHDEAHGVISKRITSNYKSVIFTESAFEQSFLQSPGQADFIGSADQGHTKTLPVDLHIDLGNYCNLACKMCSAQASSTIAAQQVQWGQETSRKYLGTDWTKNSQVWNSFLEQLLQLPGLNNIHFMGGETLLTKRFEQLVDFFIQHERFDLCFSFVTNGTVFKSDLLNKLKLFRRVGIEVSIETVDQHNAYQRQGTDLAQVLQNIKLYQTHCNNTSVTVTLRPAVSALTIGYHHTLLEFALQNQLVIKSNQVYRPAFLNVAVLPGAVKQQYLHSYEKFLQQLPVLTQQHFNTSDPNNYIAVIKTHTEACINMLTAPDQIELLPQLVAHCGKWDQVYNFNARQLYPEWQDFLDQYGYPASS